MTAPGGASHGLDSCNPLAALVDQVVDETLRRLLVELPQLVRQELARGAEPATWLTQAQAARRAGVSPSTIRCWQVAGQLARGRRSRVNREELDRLLASTGRRAPAPTLDLSRERAKRAAAEILAGFDGRKGIR